MSSELADGEFWLPPEFLTDDDILVDFKPKPHKRDFDSVLLFPSDCSAGFNSVNPHSGLSSPVESMASSEGEEDDYLAGLTRKMANSSILDGLWKQETQKSLGIFVSPEPTLCGCKYGSSRVNPNCPSRSSAAGLEQNDAGWDLIYAAAGEAARMRMMEEANACFKNRGFNPSLGFRSNHPLSYQQLQIAKFQQLRRDQLLKLLQVRNAAAPRARTGDRPPTTWPTPQQSLQLPQPATAASGTRAVFLGSNGARRECAGTGVFLPRRPGTAPEPLQKSGGAVSGPRSYLRAPPTAVHTDLRLPQEWTY